LSILTETELLKKLRTGEDSFTQYKSEIKNVDSLAEEMVAFANGGGGYILVGIAEDETGRGKVVGVPNLKNLNNHISNASSENTVPAIIAKTESMVIDDKTVVIIRVEEGNQKPYRTKGGKYIVRSGADKRAVSQEELSRMLQASGSFHVEELAVRGANIETESDRLKLAEYFEKTYNGLPLTLYLEQNNQSLETLLNNLGIA
jgi:predicted HTH transcriptional regulator